MTCSIQKKIFSVSPQRFNQRQLHLSRAPRMSSTSLDTPVKRTNMESDNLATSEGTPTKRRKMETDGHVTSKALSTRPERGHTPVLAGLRSQDLSQLLSAVESSKSDLAEAIAVKERICDQAANLFDDPNELQRLLHSVAADIEGHLSAKNPWIVHKLAAAFEDERNAKRELELFEEALEAVDLTAAQTKRLFQQHVRDLRDENSQVTRSTSK